MQNPKKKKSGSLIWILVVTGIVILLVFLGFKNRSKGELAVTFETVSKRTLIASVSEAGTIQPKVEVKVAPDVSGEVVELKFREGDRVKKGDLLVTIRPDNYKSAMEQSQAALNSAEANYMQAKSAQAQARSKFLQDSANFKRNDELYQQKVLSRAEWETYRLNYDVARSQMESAAQQVQAAFFQTQSAKASLAQARQNLDRTSIYASMDGIITLQNVELGERVVGTMQMQGTEMLRIADLSRMEVTVDINENDVVTLRPGDSALVEVDAFREKKFYGRVTEIAYSATQSLTGTTDQITNFQVKVEIDPASYESDVALMRGLTAGQSPFRPGMSARVQIYTEKKEDVIAVPIGAVTLKKNEGMEKISKPQEIVFVYDEKTGNVTEQDVKSGISDDEFIEIETGLKGGETIVTGPYLILTKDLKDGVHVVKKTEAENGKAEGDSAKAK